MGEERPVKVEQSNGLLNKLWMPRTTAPVPKVGGKQAQLLLSTHEDMALGWFWATDAEGNLTYLTSSIAKLFGKTAETIETLPLLDLFVVQDGETDRARTLPFMLMRQAKFSGMALQAALADEKRWWAVSGQPIFDKVGEFTGYRGSATDITRQREEEEESSRLTMHDSLTGLLNRPRMAHLLERTMTAFKHQNRTCTVMLIDLDRFKQVNDTLGHPAGDALLQQVAERLVKIVGDAGEVGRLGGDEFQVILPDGDDRGKVGALADRIISSLSQPYSIEGVRCIIGASVGVAVAPFDGDTSEELIRNADLALYAAKGGGRGRFRFFSSEMLEEAEDRRALEYDLIDALAKDQMELHYQPIVNALTNMVTGCEALIRWQHPERGYVSPGLFIPLAEESNLICKLGDWILRRACEDVAQWPGDLRVAVNVSPVQFANEQLPSVVLSALASSGLRPDRLELEITEGVFLADSRETDAMFTKLKDIGVRLALDDFGTGYSSLSYLRTAPFDKIKIDQSFVRGANEPKSRNKALIAAIVALAETLGMETTAEGIESHDQLTLVRSLNVSHVQGYIYSKAVPSAVFVDQIGSGEWVIAPTGPAKQRSERVSTYRKIGVIHGNHYYPVVMRNLSATGALIEGMLEVPVGTHLVVDFGDGQLSVAKVRRSRKHQQGIQFEQPLVSDGDGGLCTSYRVSPYMLAAVGVPQTNVRNGGLPIASPVDGALTLPEFRTTGDFPGAGSEAPTTPSIYPLPPVRNKARVGRR